MALLNVRSLNNKSFLVNDFINTSKLDFMFLTETWLEQNNSATVLIETAPPNYNFFDACRSGKRGGGVAAIFKNVFQGKQMLFGDFPSFEYLSAVLKCSPRVLLLIIYRPPTYSANFFDEFTELLSSISTEFDCLVITGDFNFHTDDLNDKCAKKLFTILDTFELSQHVKETTHCKGHTLDLVITKGLNVSDLSVTDPSLSDHFCVFFNISFIPDIQTKSNTVKKRYINEDSNVLFKKAISLLPPLNPCSADDLVENFNLKILKVIDVIAPYKVKTISGKQKAPWRKAASVTAQKKECRKVERIWRKTKLHIHHDIYKESLRAYNLDLKNARETFFSNIIKTNTNNAKTLFATVDRLTNPPTEIPPDLHSTQKCNEFAAFYIDKIEGIRRAINISTSNKNVGLPPCSGKNYVARMACFDVIDSQNLVETVTQLKPSTCCLDTIPTNLFKNVFDCLAVDILQIVNNSLQSGNFPKALKTAVIKPLLKKRSLDASIINNYRPISNLPFISKIIEKVVLQQLNHFLASTGCYDTFQSGFRPLHSTETALIKVVNDIRLNTDSGKTSILMLLDLSAAFDTVDHTLLLERLENWVGLSGTVLNWFRSYLQNRNYFVSIGDFVSESTNVTCGVPQGSILGPSLFNIYMLPLGQIMQNNNIDHHCYADDTQIYVSLSPNDYRPIDLLCQCIEQVKEWMCRNFLQLNEDKTEIIVFGSKTERLKVTQHLHSLSLKTSIKARNLGVIMDSDLHFDSHIKSVTKSAYYHLKNVARLRGLMSTEDLQKLVHAFITSKLDYCNGLLTGLPKQTLRKLQLVQNAAARVLTKTKRFDHITPILKSLHWLPVGQRIDFKIMLLTYKSLHGLGPKYLTDMLPLHKPSRTLRSSETNLLIIPRVNTKHGKAGFSYYATNSWNKLPEDLRLAPTLSTFKTRLKTFMFAIAFC